MENYEKIKKIGQGTFGNVWKVRRKSDSKEVVWKELDYGNMSDKEKKQLVSEVNILRDLKHPNIVRYYDRIIDKENTKIFIIMEYCKGGDISHLIKRCIEGGQHIPEDQIWKIFTQIIEALYECHNRKSGKILHRDIKPGNLFLDTENNVKLGDFGLARIMGKESLYAYTNVGTPYYMSPEQINENKYNEKSDIWSTGCILYEIASLKPPFEASTQMALAKKINEGKYNRLPVIYSEELWRVINLMMNSDQEKRPSVQDLVNFPQVSLRLREKRMKDHYSKLKKREEELKKKEAKYLEQDNEILNLKEKLKLKDQEIEDKDRIIEELMEKLAGSQRSYETSIETPKILGERKSSLRDGNSRVQDSSSGYSSLKQEIQELTSKLSYETSIPTRLKKQASCLSKKTDELSVNTSCEREARRGVTAKHNLGYKSCERKRRTYDTKISSHKPYNYKASSRPRLADGLGKENVSQNRLNQKNSCDRGSFTREEYTTPPFKSYKSKISNNEHERVRTTSYRPRAGIYPTGNTKHKGYKHGDGGSTTYTTSRDGQSNALILRRELSNN
ncbi:unnamed protein product [Moneuplotes crassus]|uniref:non-specific serine/threonine protein kinase n=1 Tax=Euplotes crassus TaxID=5936 RepID=A0AAD1X760_EUPCR|nr:unnamed protein product [Moneuplotes crassus]